MCSRYSSSVVAPIRRNSPRASSGFNMFEASIEPSDAPAPTTVCSSSMKVMIWPSALLISLSTALRRSSNSPRYFAPATIDARSSDTSRRPFSESGTSPLTMRWARPSTTAVLPTPASPMSTGLFLVRRLSTCATRRISESRPITGSSLPSLARWVRSIEYLSSADSPPSDSALVMRLSPRESLNAFSRAAVVTPFDARMFFASESTSARAMSRCSVLTNWSPSLSARVSASASTLASAPDSCGCATEEPELLGSLSMAAEAAPSTRAASAPTAFSSGATELSGTMSIACSRCTGSAVGLPLVRASLTAAVTASRLIVVSFSVSISPSSQFPGSAAPGPQRPGPRSTGQSPH